jgi:2-methylcitrate dehydratase
MRILTVRTVPASQALPKESQLAWNLARVAVEPVTYPRETVDMVGNRVVDNTAVAVAALNRRPVVNIRTQALAHPRPGGATLLGMPPDRTFEAEWAAYANATAVRELDFHDTFLAEEYSHPGDNLSPILAVAQQCGRSGADVVRGAVAAYEVQIALAKGISLHRYKKDHVGHLAASTAAGVSACLGLDVETTYQAIQQAVHLGFSTRQSRKGEISSWKAYAPGWTGKLAIEAVDRAMRGERSPSPIYEGEDGVIAWMLGGPGATYEVPLPETDEPRRAILESYTKEHSAEYQAQAIIDLAFRLRSKIPDIDIIDEVVLHTSHHTHVVIGSGSGDPQKYDPEASRETLDHSVMYCFAVALQDGAWHHEKSYTRQRATRPDTVDLWRKVRTVEDPAWTRRYLDPDPSRKAFGARAEVRLRTSAVIMEELAVADAHPNGARPFARPDYERKFKTLAEGWLDPGEGERFLMLARRLDTLSPAEVRALTVTLPGGRMVATERDTRGIF